MSFRYRTPADRTVVRLVARYDDVNELPAGAEAFVRYSGTPAFVPLADVDGIDSAIAAAASKGGTLVEMFDDVGSTLTVCFACPDGCWDFSEVMFADADGADLVERR